VSSSHRFRVNKDRRQHVHQQIDEAKLDMTHVTERKGSQQTLVCTKTRRRYELRMSQYKADLDAFKDLIAMADGVGCKQDKLMAAMQQAI
jgi:hypothetical protein